MSRLLKGKRPYLIAEIGQNHNGSIDLARQLVDSAVRCGFHAVKSAKRDIPTNVPEPLYSSPYNSPHAFGRTYGEHRQALELSREDYATLADYARKQGLDFISSFTDLPSLEFLMTIGVDALKIASSRVKDRPLLERVATCGRPVILSTGMSDMEDVEEAVALLGGGELYILQCTSSYPCQLEDIHLEVMRTYRSRFSLPVGFSGHHAGTVLPDLLAVALGACIIERHITLDRTMKGSDQALSLDEEGMRELVAGISRVQSVLGDPRKRCLPCEETSRKKLRNLSLT